MYQNQSKISYLKKLKRLIKTIFNKNRLQADLIYPFVYIFTRKYFNHYLWPAHVHSRNYNYKTNKKYHKGDLINLGGGIRFFADKWLNVDYLEGFENLEEGYNGKIGLNLSQYLDDLPFENVKQYFISHVIEHFKINDSIRLLKACYKSLDKEGILRIVVPDADLIINRLRENDIQYFKPIFPCFSKDDQVKLNKIDLLYFLLLTPKSRFEHKSYSKLRNSKNINYSNEDYSILDKTNNEIIDKLNNHNFEQNNVGLYHLSSFNDDNLAKILKEVGFKEVYKSAFMQSRSEEMRNTPMIDGTHPWLSCYFEAIK